MNTARLQIYVLSIFISVGCESYRESARNTTHAVGGIMIRDIQQANQLKSVLPTYLGLPSNRVRVEPGSGVTHVSLSGVYSQEEEKIITTKIQDLQTKNPKMDPIKLHFKR